MRHSVATAIGAYALLASACGAGEGGGEDALEASSEVATSVAGSEQSAPATVNLGISQGTVQSAGSSRQYLLYVPDSYDDAEPWPLVVVFHGYTMNASQQLSESGIEAAAEKEGFLAVFPQGRGEYQRWLFELDEVDIDVSTANPDIAFVGDLIEHLRESLNVDTDRIYAAGFSNGGWMASAVACLMPETFAAVAPVAGIMDFGDACDSSSPVPLVTFHGTADQFEPFMGGVENAPLQGWATDGPRWHATTNCR